MLLQTRASGDTEPVTTDGITQKGFMQLLMSMVEHERADLVWRMLIMFGYDRKLSLAPEATQKIPTRQANPVRPCHQRNREACTAKHALDKCLL